MHIRRMTLDDMSQVIAIETGAHKNPWTEAIFRTCVERGYRCWVLEVDRQVIGYALALQHVDEDHLLNLAIVPKMQQKGYGQHLLQHMIADAKSLEGVRRILLEVRISNTPAIQLYEKNGFLQMSLRKNYYQAGDKREHALVYLLQFEN